MSAPEIVVVGGGVVGCAAAYFLSRAGATVTLLERDGLASHASGAAAGMLAPICEAGEEGPLFFEMGLRSLEAFPALAAELTELSGIDPQLVPSGVLRAALLEEEAVRLQAQAAQRPGYDLEWLSAGAAREREPHLGPEVAGALWSPREAHVMSPLLAQAYAQAAARCGATIRTGVLALGLAQQGGRVVGVLTPEGELPAGHVLLCAGVWTRFCVEWLGRRLPLEPVRGQILALESPSPPLRTIIWGSAAYLVPKRTGQVVVGATSERAGFDARATAGGIGGLLAAAPHLAPALAGCAFRQAWAGLRPETPDHLPAIGPVPGVEGVSLAAGHYRNGVLLSPATGELVTGWLLRGELPPRALLPERLLRLAEPAAAPDAGSEGPPPPHA